MNSYCRVIYNFVLEFLFILAVIVDVVLIILCGLFSHCNIIFIHSLVWIDMLFQLFVKKKKNSESMRKKIQERRCYQYEILILIGKIKFSTCK